MFYLSCTLPHPGPVLTAEGQEEWHIHNIVDQRVHGWGMQYLMHWKGWGDEENCRQELADTEALDCWLEQNQD